MTGIKAFINGWKTSTGCIGKNRRCIKIQNRPGLNGLTEMTQITASSLSCEKDRRSRRDRNPDHLQFHTHIPLWLSGGRSCRRLLERNLNSDGKEYCGSGLGNSGGVQADEAWFRDRPHSLNLLLPPLAVCFFQKSS